jgi:hypothetical protein
MDMRVYGYRRARERPREGEESEGEGGSGDKSFCRLAMNMEDYCIENTFYLIDNTFYSGELLYVTRVCKPLSVSLSLSQRLTGRTVFGHAGGREGGGGGWGGM